MGSLDITTGYGMEASKHRYCFCVIYMFIITVVWCRVRYHIKVPTDYIVGFYFYNILYIPVKMDCQSLAHKII